MGSELEQPEEATQARGEAESGGARAGDEGPESVADRLVEGAFFR